MKKMITFITLLLFFTVVPAFAINYCKDFLEPGNPGGATNSKKTFDEDITINAGQTVDVDIWINDAPSNLISGGFFLTFDPDKLSIVQVKAYDGDLNGTQGNPSPCCPGLDGPWDPGATTQVPDADGPGTYFVALAQFGCIDPDSGGDIILGRISFKVISSGDATITVKAIPGFDTIVACDGGVIYDPQISPNTITISQGSGSSTITTTGPGSTSTTSPSTTTGPSSTSTTSPTTTSADTSTTTTTSSNRWQLVYTKMWAADADKKLALLRAFRDEVVTRSESGKNYISLLYRHSQEIATILIRYPFLCLETGKVIDNLLPSIESFFETKKLNLTLAQRDSIESVLTNFEAKAGTQLKELIKNVKEDFKGGKIAL